MRKRNLKLVIVLTILVSLCATFVAPMAQAAKNDYGFWFGNDKNDLQAYQADVKPFNDRNVPEILNYGCVLSDGTPLSEDQRDQLSNIFVAAGQVYNGTFDISGRLGTDGGGFYADDRKKLEKAEKERDAKSSFENGGYQKGTKGMQAFISNEKNLLSKGSWINFDKREIKGDGSKNKGSYDYQQPNGTWVHISKDAVKGVKEEGSWYTPHFFESSDDDDKNTFGSDGLAGWVGTKVEITDVGKNQQYLNKLIKANAKNPLELYQFLPQGCIIGGVHSAIPNFSDILNNPVDAITAMVVGILNKPVEIIFDQVKTTAWQWSFWTPHSERGDLIWQIPPSCVMEDMTKLEKIAQQNTCKNQVPLGFRKDRTDVTKASAAYLKIAHFLQWLVSGTYFIIIFTAAVMYIFKGNRTRNLNLMNTLPRLLLSIILTLFSGFLIGAIISFANLLVTSIFGINDGANIGIVNAMISQPDEIVGGMATGGDILRLVINVIVTFFFIIFTLGAVVRQIALVILVVVAPIAFFCLINPGWQHHFNRWIRSVLVVAFVPVILAFILKISLLVNPMVTVPQGTYGNSMLGLLSIVMLLLTLWLMNRIIRSSKNFIMGQSSAATAGMDWAGNKLAAAGAERGGKLGALMSRAGGNMQTNAQNAQGLAQLVPDDKILAAGSGRLAAAGGGGGVGAARAFLGGSIAPQHASGKAGQKIAAWQAKRSVKKNFGQGSLQEISEQEYQQHQAYIKHLTSQGMDKAQAEQQVLAALGGEDFVTKGGQRYIRRSGAGLEDTWEKQNDPVTYAAKKKAEFAKSEEKRVAGGVAGAAAAGGGNAPSTNPNAPNIPGGPGGEPEHVSAADQWEDERVAEEAKQKREEMRRQREAAEQEFAKANEAAKARQQEMAKEAQRKAAKEQAKQMFDDMDIFDDLDAALEEELRRRRGK